MTAAASITTSMESAGEVVHEPARPALVQDGARRPKRRDGPVESWVREQAQALHVSQRGIYLSMRLQRLDADGALLAAVLRGEMKISQALAKIEGPRRQVGVALNEEQYECIRAAAGRLGMSMTEFVRDAALVSATAILDLPPAPDSSRSGDEP